MRTTAAFTLSFSQAAPDRHIRCSEQSRSDVILPSSLKYGPKVCGKRVLGNKGLGQRDLQELWIKSCMRVPQRRVGKRPSRVSFALIDLVSMVY